MTKPKSPTPIERSLDGITPVPRASMPTQGLRPATSRNREALLWTLVGITSAVFIVIGVVSLKHQLTQPTSSSGFLGTLRNAAGSVGSLGTDIKESWNNVFDRDGGADAPVDAATVTEWEQELFPEFKPES